MKITPLSTTIEAAIAVAFVYFVLGADEFSPKMWACMVVFAVWITATLYTKKK